MSKPRPKPSTSPQTQARFAQALGLHQQGRLREAKVRYAEVLRANPRNAEALQLLGVIAYQSNLHQEALDLIDQALVIQPDNAYFLSNRGNALKELGRLEDAVASFDKSIRLRPDYADAYCNRGIALHAMQAYEQAMQSHDRAIVLKPDFPAAYYNRGVALQDMGNLEAAVASYDKAVAQNPGFAQAYANRGLVLKQLGQLEAAMLSFEAAIKHDPQDAKTCYHWALALHEMKQLDVAIALYDRAIGIQADFAQAHYSRGLALQQMAQLDEALASYDQAIRFKPDYVDAHSNRGTILQHYQQWGAAMASYDQAIALDPTYAKAHNNRGNTLQERHQIDAALASYDQAIALEPDYADAYWNKGIALLLDGDFARGWPLYEWRHKALESTHPQRQFDQPLWLGQGSLQGKTLLLHSEQGLGDTLQFIRYAPLLAAQGARVVVELPRALMVLLADMQGVSQFIEQGQALPAYDYHCPLLSLPLAFGTTLDNIPAPAAYVRSLPSKRAQWAATLGAKAGLRIGIAWSGSTGHKNDHNRSITLAELLQHLPTGPQYISLQKELREVDQATLRANPQLRHFGPDLADFTDTAALCDLMDLVISVDTSVAHLSAALGQTTWVLLPYSPDWRWLLERSDSPWYPSARLYRQDRSMRWAGVLQRLRDDVLKRL